MKIDDTFIDGLKILELRSFNDSRGSFTKMYNSDFFSQHNLDINIKESYYSVSHRNVIRGMHFQTPPYDHVKIVHVSNGSIIDVVLDIRKNSCTFGEFFSIELSDINKKALVIPKGMAHGFMSLEDNTNVIYMQTTCYAPNNDSGIKYNSFGFDWECNNAKLSDRDLKLKMFEEFDSPFIFGETR